MSAELLIKPQDILFRKTTHDDLKIVLEIEEHQDNSPFIFTWSKEKHIDIMGLLKQEFEKNII
ncbi:hypothetical protein SAMN05444162_3537 [Paenibacillaceae bacterium GAS479]|nr:hypothetical protein SAMN05444162_3537 [Paenibacillaceae bacterium GAS479]